METVVDVDILLNGVSATQVYSPTFLGDRQSMKSRDFVEPRRNVSTSTLCWVFSNVASSSEIFGRAPYAKLINTFLISTFANIVCGFDDISLKFLQG